MKRFRVTRQAERELDDIFLYWAKRASIQLADRLIEAFEARFAMLGERPHIGRKCDHLAKDVRSFPMGEYIIYYKHLRGTTWILHVFHGARDQRKGFGKT